MTERTGNRPGGDKLPCIEWGPGNPPVPQSTTNTALAQRDLFIYWSSIRAQPLQLTQSGLVQKRLLRSLNALLLIPDLMLNAAADESEAPKLHFLRLLLQQLGLVRRRDGLVSVTSLPAQAPSYWRPSLDARAHLCVDAWVRMQDWNELDSIKLSSLDLDLEAARTALLRQLRLLPSEVWLSSERFLGLLQIAVPQLLLGRVAARQPGSLARISTDSPKQEARLEQIRGAFVGGALSGPLHWLGIVDVVTDATRLLAFRVGASGAKALRQEAGSVHESDDEGTIIVQPNFRVFAIGPVPEVTLASLETLATRVAADPHAMEYLLTRESVHGARRAGLAVPEIIDLLQVASSVPLPGNVVRTLREWETQQNRITLHRGVALCETYDEELLDRLWRDGALRTHLERRLTTTSALVKHRRALALKEALLQRSILPRSSPADAPCLRKVTALAHGELRPVHQGPDLILAACLASIADQREVRYYVTKTSVERALAHGMTPPDILRRLAGLHRGPVPNQLESQIKAWSRYYGAARMREAMLLEVRDMTIADELLADEQLATMLMRFGDESQGNVLLVQTENTELLRHLLRQRGVDLM